MMSGSDSSVKVAAFGALAFLTFTALATGAYYGSIFAPEKRHYQSVGPNSGQAYPADSPRNGLADVGGIDRLTESLIAKPKPRSSEEREERNLAAQEATAVFGYWMFVAMVLQTALALGALLALLKDLRQNRKSAEAQLRAYLSFMDFELQVFKSETRPNYWKLRLESKIHNGGQTPAYECLHMGNIVAFTEEKAAAYFSRTNSAPRIGRPIPYTVHIGGDSNAGFASHEEISPATLAEITDGEKRLFAFGEVVYRDTFGKMRSTRFCVVLASPLIPEQTDPSGITRTEIVWETAPFHNDAT